MRTEPKKSTAARMATPTAAPVDRPLYRIEKRRYMLYVMSRAITAQELSTRTSIPAILATRQDVPNIAVSSSRPGNAPVILASDSHAWDAGGVAHASSLRPGGSVRVCEIPSRHPGFRPPWAAQALRRE